MKKILHAITLLLFIAAPLLRADLTNGLVAYCKLDGNALDETGQHNGTEHDNTYAAGMYGQAAAFDGVNDYIDIGVSSDLLNSQQLTFSYWLFMDPNWKSYPYPANSSQITSYNGGSFEYGDLTLALGETNTFRIGYGTGPGQGLITDHAFDFSNEWVHVCVILDSTQTNRLDRQKLFLNGVQIPGILLQTNDTQNVFLGNTSEILRLGATIGPFASAIMVGQLDEVRIYNRILTEDEIQELAEPNRGAMTSGYYTFDVTLQTASLNDENTAIDAGNIKGLLVYNADTSACRFYELNKNGVIVSDAIFEYFPYQTHLVSKEPKTYARGTAMAKLSIDGLLNAVTLGYFQFKDIVKKEQLFISLAGTGTSDESRLYGTLSLRYNQQLSDDMNGTDDADTILGAFIQKKTGGKSKNR